MKKFYLLLFVPLIYLTSCKKEDNTPSWVVVNDFVLTTNEPVQGANTDNITDIWVYMDNQALGVFPLPCRIPVLAEGNHSFIFYPGIKQNGISATRVRYPFYERYDATLNLVKGEEIVVTPTTTYKSEVQFQLIEDFEDVGVDFVKDIISDTDMVVLDNGAYPDIVKYGTKCGAVFLNTADSIYKGATNSDLNLPGGGAEVYVEIDYMNDNSMILGVVAENSSGTNEAPLVQMNPQETSEMQWKKIYISLKDNVSNEIYATSFEISLSSVLDESKTSGVVYLDNIKVLRFQ